mmetsp:Transcript_28123/g.59809  ORF Transcript_28123/g.59809 Transcript_28123/m.59809 type:complete len:91 (-) Transcript_28123:74-346(-)
MAEEAAERGKQAFQAKDFAAAAAAYTEAIEQDGADFKHFSNRSACYAEMSKLKFEIDPARRAVQNGRRSGRTRQAGLSGKGFCRSSSRVH